MAIDRSYNRSFKVGHGSEQLWNEELHKIFEALKHIIDDCDFDKTPVAQLYGSLWEDGNDLKYYKKDENKWEIFYKKKFQMITEIMSVTPPPDPVPGQLWIYQGTLCYYTGRGWDPIKALVQDGSQFSLDIFKNFVLLSPLWQTANVVYSVDETEHIYVTYGATILQGDNLVLPMTEPTMKDVHVIVLDDTNTSSPTYGQYIDDCSAYTLSYQTNSVTVYNEANRDITIQIIYRKLVSSANAATLTSENELLITTEAIDLWAESARKYLDAVIDWTTDSRVTGDGTKWTLDHSCITEYPSMPPTFTKSQLLVPHTDFMRMFLDRDHDTTKYEEVNKVTIQYKTEDIVGHIPSLIHLNPGRMTKMTKRLFKIDRANPRIQVSAGDTEFYGFRLNEHWGHLLLPDDKDKAYCDYTIVEDGILLSYNAAQTFDYVLAIHYEFSWMKSTGRMSKLSNQDMSDYVYALDKYKGGETNVFVEGYDLEDPYYTENSKDKTISIHENVDNLEISMLKTPSHEYGYIRQINLRNEAIIHPLRTYTNPLLIVNGEALHPVHDGIVFNPDGTWTIPGGKLDMMWSIIDLYEAETDYRASIEAGTVAPDNLIHYNPATLPDTTYSNAVLFVEGLIVKKEHLIFDRINKTLDVAGSGLRPGQTYILVEDKYEWLYDEKLLVRAYSIGRVSDTLVYFDGKLILNEVSLDTVLLESDLVGEAAAYNEVKCFKNPLSTSDSNPLVKIYDPKTRTWSPLSRSESDGIKYFAYTYTNGPKSIRIDETLLPYSKKNNIVIYAFLLANEVEHGLIIDNIIADRDHPILTVGSRMYYDETTGTEKDIYDDPCWVINHLRDHDTWILANLDPVKTGGITPTPAQLEDPTWVLNNLTSSALADISNHTWIFSNISDPYWNKLAAEYLFEKNTLRVWVNGVRIYPDSGDYCLGIKEILEGKTFRLPEPTVGKITYIIEYPENDMAMPCTTEFLDHRNIPYGLINTYKTKLPLFPGRVTLYIDGIRQPNNAYTIFDNHTLLIHSDEGLIGDYQNYPVKTIQLGNKTKDLKRNYPDIILVEVRQDERQEITFVDDTHPLYEINLAKNRIPVEILEPEDEILIFVNGLFFGTKYDNGYFLNRPKGCITINQEDTLGVMNYDEEALHLGVTGESTPEAIAAKMGRDHEHRKYLTRHNNIDYIRKSAEITLEWR